MATLPDGDSVTARFGPEGWESIGKTVGTSQFGPESWEQVITIAGELSISVDKTTVEKGETVTASGAITDPNGRGLANRSATVNLSKDGILIDSNSQNTDSEGTYSLGVTPDETGEMTLVMESPVIGPQFGPEAWESIGLPITSQFGPEGWEQ